MIYMRSGNPERLEDVFALTHYPSLYFMIVLPFIFLSCIAWLSLYNKKFSKVPIIKRILWLIIPMALIAIPLLWVPVLYIATIPYILLYTIIWLILSHQNLSGVYMVKRIFGLVISFVAIGCWGLAVSMPFVMGLGAYFFLFCSPILLLLTYFFGGSIGYRIVKCLFPKAKIMQLVEVNYYKQTQDIKQELCDYDNK